MNIYRVKLPIALMMLAISHSPLAAQGTSSDNSDEAASVAACSDAAPTNDLVNTLFECAQKQTADEPVVQRVQSNSTDAAFGTLPSRVNLRADQDGESASFSLGSSDSKVGGLFKTDYALKATVPFSKKKDRGDFITQAGLANIYALEASISLRVLGSSSNRQIRDAIELEAVDLATRVRARCLSLQSQSDASKQLKDAKCGDPIRTIAPLVGMEAEVESAFTAVEKLYLQQKYLTLQITGGVGREGFDHRDPTTLAEIEDNRAVYSASASLVYLPTLQSSLAYIAGVEFERQFELPDEEIRCPAGQAAGPTVTCFSAAFGPPTRDESTTFFAGIRYVGDNKKLPIGIELRFAIDPGNGEWGVEAPVYFVRNSKDELNAGVRFAYDSEKDDGSVGLFIGRSFGGLLGN